MKQKGFWEAGEIYRAKILVGCPTSLRSAPCRLKIRRQISRLDVSVFLIGITTLFEIHRAFLLVDIVAFIRFLFTVARCRHQNWNRSTTNASHASHASHASNNSLDGRKTSASLTSAHERSKETIHSDVSDARLNPSRSGSCSSQPPGMDRTKQ